MGPYHKYDTNNSSLVGTSNLCEDNSLTTQSDVNPGIKSEPIQLWGYTAPTISENLLSTTLILLEYKCIILWNKKYIITWNKQYIIISNKQYIIISN